MGLEWFSDFRDLLAKWGHFGTVAIAESQIFMAERIPSDHCFPAFLRTR